MLLTSAIHKAGLRGHAYTDETNFQAQLHTKQPRFTILTDDCLDNAGLVSSLRTCSPHAHLILCVLPEVIPSERLWPLLNTVDVDSICTIHELTDCLRNLTTGGFFVSSLLSNYSIHNTKESLPGWHDLTQSERRILQKLAEGQTGPQIADSLCISPKTVNNHKAKIALKLNVFGGPGCLIRFVLLNRDKILALLVSHG